jgi:hypothetical protein
VKPRTAVAIVDLALMAACFVSLLALVLVMAAPAHAGQALYNNGAGFRYTRPMPNPGQWYAPPAARYAAPVPRYYPGYLQGYVRPYRPKSVGTKSWRRWNGFVKSSRRLKYAVSYRRLVSRRTC